MPKPQKKNAAAVALGRRGGKIGGPARAASMTAEERKIANAALGAGPWDNHDQIVIAAADGLGLEPQTIETVLQRLRVRRVVNCISSATTGSESPSVRYERGMDWTEKE